MELILFCGIQATGKTSFYRERFSDTHLRLNFDMLKTRHRESLLVAACLESKTPFVIDNTNPSRADRARYIEPAKTARFTIHGYFFESKIADALERNATRSGKAHVLELGIRGTFKKLELPSLAEGFDTLHFVRMSNNQFTVEEWKNEV
jgi:predicted kinase